MGENKQNQNKKCKTIIIVEIECSNSGLCESWVEIEIRYSVDLQMIRLLLFQSARMCVSVRREKQVNMKQKDKFNRKKHFNRKG